jgi:hypothetical protein
MQQLGDITHVKPMSKMYILQLVSFHTFFYSIEAKGVMLTNRK